MSTADARHALEAAYRGEARRVLATLIRLLGGFEAAEEALHEAFAAAAEQWPREGVPANPYAWLVSAGRFKTIDRWRRQARLAGAVRELAAQSALRAGADAARADSGRRAAAHLHLLPSGARAGRAHRAHAARGGRADHRGDRPGLSACPRRRSRSASSARRRRSATTPFPTRSRRAPSCRRGSRACCR